MGPAAGLGDGGMQAGGGVLGGGGLLLQLARPLLSRGGQLIDEGERNLLDALAHNVERAIGDSDNVIRMNLVTTRGLGVLDGGCHLAALDLVERFGHGLGDFIEVGGKSGTVRQIGVFHTQIATPDNQLVYLPNSHITSAEITNVTGSELRRIELTVQASYDAPPETVKAALVRAAQHPKRVEKEPVFARPSAYGDSAVSYTLRLWTAGSDYWDVYYDVLEAVGREFRESNIEMTYPHINVHMDS